MARRLNENLFAVGTLAATLFVVASSWDEQDARRRASDLKDDAIKYAVEHYGRREHFASSAHCRVPMKGERLVMQHASPRDAGQGYRCTYYIVMTPPGIVPAVEVTWSRSAESARRVAAGRDAP